MSIYVGANGVKEIKNIYVGHSGVKDVKEIYVGVNGTPRKVWPVYPYGESVDLLTYKSGSSLYRVNGNTGAGNTATKVYSNINSSTVYDATYDTGGTCYYACTYNIYDLSKYNYIMYAIVEQFDGSNISHRCSIATEYNTSPMDDTLRKGTDVHNAVNQYEYKVLIDITNITVSTYYYIKAGTFISGGSGLKPFRISEFSLHVDRPSGTFDYEGQF